MQASLSLQHDGPQPKGAVSGFLSTQFAKSAILPMDGVLDLALKDKVPLTTWIDFHELAGFTIEYENAFLRLDNLAISVVFVNFYDKYNDWLHDNVSGKPRDWPDVLQFTRLVRNAMAHDGCILIRGERAVGAKWHHLAYEKADNGTRLIGTSLHAGDLLILLVEASQELDRLLTAAAPSA